MKYLKKFEHFSGHDLGRFSEEDELRPAHEIGAEEDMYSDIQSEEEFEEDETEEDTYAHEREEERGRVWGDEVVEGKKAKPDFLDLDKDGNKKESMKKAAKDAKEKDSKKEEKGGKGLTAAQKKLPEGLRKAIEAKNKKK